MKNTEGFDKRLFMLNVDKILWLKISFIGGGFNYSKIHKFSLILTGPHIIDKTFNMGHGMVTWYKLPEC